MSRACVRSRRVAAAATVVLTIVFCALVTGACPVLAGERTFPFGSELTLDVAPMKGSKHVPSLDIDAQGLADIDLWCSSVKGQMVVAGDTITILTGEKAERDCPPERVQADDDVLAALTGVTNWRRDGDVLTLTGARTMRFRLQSN
jgi:heat shock protein HslJ